MADHKFYDEQGWDEVEHYKKQVEELQRKIDYYEAPLPLGKGNCDHRFTDEGLCVRCGEDAEEWDAGCVEEIVEDLQSITTREFANNLAELVKIAKGGDEDYAAGRYPEIAVVESYLAKVEKFVEGWELVESWKDRSEPTAAPDDDDFVLDL